MGLQNEQPRTRNTRFFLGLLSIAMVKICFRLTSYLPTFLSSRIFFGRQTGSLSIFLFKAFFFWTGKPGFLTNFSSKANFVFERSSLITDIVDQFAWTTDKYFCLTLWKNSANKSCVHGKLTCTQLIVSMVNLHFYPLWRFARARKAFDARANNDKLS